MPAKLEPSRSGAKLDGSADENSERLLWITGCCLTLALLLTATVVVVIAVVGFSEPVIESAITP